jgi:O-antigen/teichoic acid export membrane protein
MSRTRRLLRGAAAYYVSQLIMLVASLWVTPFILSRVGPFDFGMWLVGLQVLAYLALADLGVMAVVPRATAAATGQLGREALARELPALLGRTARLVAWQVPFLAAVVALVWFNLPADWAALRGPIGVVMLGYVVLFPCRLFQAALAGLQDFTFLNVIQTAAWFVQLVLNVVLVWAGFGLWALAWGWVGQQVTQHAGCWLRLRLRFPEYRPAWKQRLHGAWLKSHLSQGVWLSLSQLAFCLVSATDSLLIGLALGPAAVVPYACTAKLIQVVGGQALAVLQMSLPGLTEMRVSSSPESARRVCLLLSQSQLLVTGAVCCVILAVNGPFVTWWIGAEYYGGLGLTALLLLVVLLRHWNATAVFALYSFERERRTTLTTAADGLVTVGASALFIVLFGIKGAPLGSLVGVALVSLPANLSALAGSLGVSRARLVAPLWGWGWRFGLVAAGLVALGRVYQLGGIVGVAVAAALGGTAYLVVMLPVVLKSPLGERLLPAWLVARKPAARPEALPRSEIYEGVRS